jgi:peptide deformylase
MREEVDPGIVQGTKLRVLKYPNPLLREKNSEVDLFDEQLRRISSEMILLMFASQGIGLAAPQVGVAHSVHSMKI